MCQTSPNQRTRPHQATVGTDRQGSLANCNLPLRNVTPSATWPARLTAGSPPGRRSRLRAWNEHSCWLFTSLQPLSLQSRECGTVPLWLLRFTIGAQLQLFTPFCCCRSCCKGDWSCFCYCLHLCPVSGLTSVATEGEKNPVALNCTCFQSHAMIPVLGSPTLGGIGGGGGWRPSLEWIHACMHGHTCMHACICTCMCICIHAFACICICIYI